MTTRLTLVLLLLSGVSLASDPYQGIQRLTLSNGMNVVFVAVPNARQIELQLKIDSGWKEETQQNRGVAHLLEHLIQRDSRLGPLQSYANLFREDVGGALTGVTSWKNTSFSVIVPSLKGVWALNEFHRMISLRTFTVEELDRAKAEVWREIGEPRDPILSFLEGLYPPKWVLPDFFATEFGIDSHAGANESAQNSIRWLGLEDLRSFYREHYVPNNMTLFYSGPFKGKETFGFIRETFEKDPAAESPSKNEAFLKPRSKPYVRSAVAIQAPWASVGTKFWDIEPEDEMALQILFDSLMDVFIDEMASHETSLSNVEKKIWVDEDRYGYAVLNFELGPLGYGNDFKRICDLVRRKAFLGELSESEVLTAKKKIRKRIEEWDGNSDVQLKLAQTLINFQENYETDQTPLQVLEKLSHGEIKKRLAKLFSPERGYVVKWEPPLVFKGEAFVLWGVLALSALFGFQFLFARNFPHTRVRYVRKIRYGPFFIVLALFIYLNILWAVCQLFQMLETLLLGVNLVQGSYLINQYLETGLFVFAVTTVTLFFLGSIPRKILIVDNRLWIKSISFRSRRFSRNMIQTIFCCRPYQLLTKGYFKEWPRLFHWALWNKGLFIELKDGTSYFLGFSDADQVVKELDEIFRQRTREDVLAETALKEAESQRKQAGS